MKKNHRDPFPDGVPPSPTRSDGAICPLWAQCGGCATPHTDLAAQHRQKKETVEQAFAQVGWAVDLPLFFSGDPWGYRSRMDFAVFEFGFGQRRKGSFRGILPVKDCLLANDGVRDVLAKLWPWFESRKEDLDPYHVARQTGTVKYAVVRAATFTDSRCVSFVLNGGSDKQESAIGAIRDFADSAGAPQVVYGVTPAKSEVSVIPADVAHGVNGNGILVEKILGRILSYHSQGFFQVNSPMIQVLVETVRGWVEETMPSPTQLWDFYGGAGTFAVALGDLFQESLVLDMDGPNVKLAGENLSANGVRGRIIHLDAAEIAAVPLKADGGTLCVLDPPRSGLHPKALEAIMAVHPPFILYISCNPAQLAREWPTWTKAYEPVQKGLFDLFPQTPHVECAVLLRQK